MKRQLSTMRTSAGLRLGAALLLPISSVQHQNSRPRESLRHRRRRWLGLSLGVIVGLVVTGFAFPATAIAGDADTRPTVTVLVYNYSQASPTVLAGAEREAGRILGEAGLQPVWLACPVEPSTVQGPCQKAPEPTDIRLRVLAAPLQHRFKDTVFGFTIHPVLASVYYEGVVRRAKSDDAEFEVPTILGCAIAHELGHLLLGPNGHSQGGIMQGEWEPKQFHLALMGGLVFVSQQAKLIQAEARRRMSLQTGALKEQRLATVDQRVEPRIIPESD